MRFHIHVNEGVYDWSLEGSPPDYPVLAIGPEVYRTEAEARSAITIARKAMAGYKFAKVVVDDLP